MCLSFYELHFETTIVYYLFNGGKKTSNIKNSLYTNSQINYVTVKTNFNDIDNYFDTI